MKIDGISLRIKQLQEHFNISQTKLAEEISSDQATISRIVVTENTSPIMLKVISLAFSVRYDWLLTGEGEMIDNNCYCQNCKRKDEEIQRLWKVVGNYEKTIGRLEEELEGYKGSQKSQSCG